MARFFDSGIRNRAPPRVADRGMLATSAFQSGGYWENKILRADQIPE